VMNEWLTQDLPKVKKGGYADDTLAWSEDEFVCTPNKESGIVIHEEKSGWVKKHGKWLKPLKFLGLTFDGENLQASTRNGANLKVTPEVMLLTEILSLPAKSIGKFDDMMSLLDERLAQAESNSYANPKTNWEMFFKSKILGFIQSRLYQDKYNLGNLEQDFDIK
jgi:hypothetical protein